MLEETFLNNLFSVRIMKNKNGWVFKKIKIMFLHNLCTVILKILNDYTKVAFNYIYIILFNKF